MKRSTDRNSMFGDRWIIEKVAQFPAAANPWRMLPPYDLYVENRADVTTYRSGAEALAAFNSGGRTSGFSWVPDLTSNGAQ